MAVTGMSPELQCDHDQLVCPLQNITCQCVVTEEYSYIIWYLHSEFVGYFSYFGSSVIGNPNYTATVEVLGKGLLSSNLSFPAELQSGPLTVECEDANAIPNNMLFLIEGLFFEV